MYDGHCFIYWKCIKHAYLDYADIFCHVLGKMEERFITDYNARLNKPETSIELNKNTVLSNDELIANAHVGAYRPIAWSILLKSKI